MCTHISFSLAQQHIGDLRIAADRRRLAAEGSEIRPGFARRLRQIARVQRGPWAATARVPLSPNA